MALPAVAGPMTLADAADQRCRAGASASGFQPALPIATKTLRDTGKLTIVAIGSSTTAGAGASGEDKSYPTVLQDELRRRLPQAEIRVVNRGVGGQSAYEMLTRMNTDVIEQAPALVIWQTVAADVVNHVGEDKLAKILKKGIRKIQGAGIDLVMMDLPWLQRADRYPHYDDYRAVLKRAADASGVPVFPRYGMMKEWAHSQRFTPEELIGMNGTELVEAGYRCLAIRIADGVAAAVTTARPERTEARKVTY
ncbi:SGNH/GDSL hydrolase family protein [Bosea sp. (in: a-proteobacteria)]|uniref:SGNH/GDSL hydrolase family protein n=1 Tax=Bosea sp. (in: a-proteobacteria) TaxID=1871050 RepID=UPI002737441E|nr:SGNH/GDSL hydrolase family protein [Bosea sp. (in: a-proteobacteria)]MDP3410951.1 SGNH/GDSL hydrolase family protein [Bosea sp. (in: a-proteobacteria)]